MNLEKFLQRWSEEKTNQRPGEKTGWGFPLSPISNLIPTQTTDGWLEIVPTEPCKSENHPISGNFDWILTVTPYE